MKQRCSSRERRCGNRFAFRALEPACLVSLLLPQGKACDPTSCTIRACCSSCSCPKSGSRGIKRRNEKHRPSRHSQLCLHWTTRELQLRPARPGRSALSFLRPIVNSFLTFSVPLCRAQPSISCYPLDIHKPSNTPTLYSVLPSHSPLHTPFRPPPAQQSP